uniref:Zinc finger protein 710 n=1 Tax=Melanaphis sacchari TaxID=742174 RepID=A0A2H8TR22_9HEMI
MFKCDQCSSMFTRKDNLLIHKKTHASLRFLCTICPMKFNYKTNLNRHYKHVHGMYLYNIIYFCHSILIYIFFFSRYPYRIRASSTSRKYIKFVLPQPELPNTNERIVFGNSSPCLNCIVSGVSML